MSSPDESTLKAGHPPAVKAGGMRITQHKPPNKEKPEKDANAQEGDDHINSLTAPTSPFKPSALVSGAPVKGSTEKPEAIQQYHNKPLPTHDARTAHDKPNVIQQPRK